MSTIDTASNFGYAMVKSGPAVDTRDVESEGSAIEVAVLWGSTVLRVVHLLPSCSFYVGDDSGGGGAQCDYVVPLATLGAARAPVVFSRGDRQCVVILPRTHGTLDIPGEERTTLAALVASGRAQASTEVYGAYEYELPPNAKATIELDDSDISFQVTATHAGKRLAAGWLTGSEPTALVYAGLSFLLHVGAVAALACLMPHMHADDTEAIDADRILMMQKLLDASADREQAARQTHDESNSAESRGGSGAAARGEAGAMGTPKASEVAHRYAVAGPADNRDPHLSRSALLEDVAHAPLIGMLTAAFASDPNAPTALWGRDESSGTDPTSALGSIFGDTIGMALGTGGLGLSGAGMGGGGPSDGIGLNDFGFDHGHGRGGGPSDGIGVGRGRPNGGHTVRLLGMRDSTPTVNGRIPKEVIQRIVHQNFGRFRFCYENALRSNPTLAGHVTVKFAIDRTGAVMVASDGGSDLRDLSAVACVVRSFSNLSFPPPEGGIVTVSYGFDLSPGSE